MLVRVALFHADFMFELLQPLTLISIQTCKTCHIYNTIWIRILVLLSTGVMCYVVILCLLTLLLFLIVFILFTLAINAILNCCNVTLFLIGSVYSMRQTGIKMQILNFSASVNSSLFDGEILG